MAAATAASGTRKDEWSHPSTARHRHARTGPPPRRIPQPHNRGGSREGTCCGRRAVRRAADRRLRRPRADPAWDGEAVIANIAGGLIALALLVYLVVALLRPEKF
ncbi:hypothetical protein Ae168Ps1_5037c [Pseudonocardia sp. Ae168_Ps1]|nr:hypothetical protein Ae150APs1_5000c [Pseudonocardia sp. Ae150A_Ps1]OLL82631.1 hypothetical protein Ae168Ps1_5037c [Pseudonocardia sp. Ae168_Ps1]OLL83255.1 hypothetical protein Ae263Ps1_0310 [Pseudonocardia sp. Ae263_Ps1]OLL90707.1 hypothetical protein Ae356Ps1_0604c [Pseudonocardia sp. Ae356_Ps1]